MKIKPKKTKTKTKNENSKIEKMKNISFGKRPHKIIMAHEYQIW